MQSQVPASGLPFPTDPEIIFANWREALHGSGLAQGVQVVYTLAVSGIPVLSRNAVSVTTASARAFMDDVIRKGLAKHPQLSGRTGSTGSSGRAAGIAPARRPWRTAPCPRSARPIREPKAHTS